MKVTTIRKNYNENDRLTEFPDSNPHSSGDISSRSSFGVQIVNYCMDHLSYTLFSLSQHFISGLGRLVFEDPHSHTIRNTNSHTHPLGFLWMSEQLVTEATTQTTNYIHKRPKSLPLAKFEPAILAIERPQIYVLDRAATRIGHILYIGLQNWYRGLHIFNHWSHRCEKLQLRATVALLLRNACIY
jgi:hypothetical protein